MPKNKKHTTPASSRTLAALKRHKDAVKGRVDSLETKIKDCKAALERGFILIPANGEEQPEQRQKLDAPDRAGLRALLDAHKLKLAETKDELKLARKEFRMAAEGVRKDMKNRLMILRGKKVAERDSAGLKANVKDIVHAALRDEDGENAAQMSEISSLYLENLAGAKRKLTGFIEETAPVVSGILADFPGLKAELYDELLKDIGKAWPAVGDGGEVRKKNKSKSKRKKQERNIS